MRYDKSPMPKNKAIEMQSGNVMLTPKILLKCKAGKLGVAMTVMMIRQRRAMFRFPSMLILKGMSALCAASFLKK